MNKIYALIVLALLPVQYVRASNIIDFDFGGTEVLEINYSGFKIYLDCNNRSAVAFEYEAKKDIGTLKRHNQFFYDPKISINCQQLSTEPYRNRTNQKYDRGHLVPANHLDHLEDGIKQSNIMINVLPQAQEMNRGAWLETEELIECYRDVENIQVIGGPIWLNYAANDYFMDTHGIKTPEFFWKIVLKSNAYIAWIIPNTSNSYKGKLDDYISSKEVIESYSNLKITIKDNLKEITSMKDWGWNLNCDHS